MKNTGMSLSKLADLILDTIDPYKRGEGKFSKQWVMEQVLVARNHFRKIDSDRSIDQREDIADDWFTERVVEILHDDVRERYYIDLPNGNVTLPNDMGIRLMPVAGSYNPYIRCPANFISMRPEISFAEGNILWTPINGQVVFPNMSLPPGSGKVVLSVIENGMPDDILAPINMPDRFEALVADKVLQLMGYRPNEDRKPDGKPGDSQ